MGLPTLEELYVITLSLKVSAVAMLLSTVPGIFAGWLLARRQFVGKSLVEALLMMPLVLPPVVTGYLLLVLLGAQGPLGAILWNLFGLRLGFTWQGAAVASAIMGLPLLVRAVRQAVEAVDQGLEQAARTLGAGPWRVFFTVTLPLCMPGVVSGLVLAFARSLGEFGATITFVGSIPGETRTLPLAIFALTQTPGGDVAAARLVGASVVISLGALLVSEGLARRRSRSNQP